MRCKIRRVAAVLALTFSVPGSFAASPQAKPKPAPAVATDSISAALCGHGKGPAAQLAKALDGFDSSAPPLIWQKVEVETLQRWLGALICPGAAEVDAELYESRHKVLNRLGRWLEATEQIGSALERFRDWRPRSVEWPSSSDCDGCAVLRSSAARVADIAFQWPPRKGITVGDRLKDVEKHKLLIAELCSARPSPRAREEIQTRFRYYSWTADGAMLLKVAEFFEQPVVIAQCSPGR